MAKMQMTIELNPELNKGEMMNAAKAVRAAMGDAVKGISFGDASKDAAAVAMGVGKIGEETQKASGIASGLGKAFAFNQIMQSVQAVSGALTEVIGVSNEFESTLAAVGAITGFSGDALGVIGDKARELAIQFGGSASDQLVSFQGILSKFGPQVAESSEALALLGKNVSTLSAASGDDAATSMSAITDSMLQFGLVTGDANVDAETSTRVINALAASAQVGAAEIPQVAQSILAAGVAAKGANQSFEQTNAAIQVLAVGGKTGSEAGTALRNVLGLLQNASGTAEVAMNQLGTSSVELGSLLTEQGLDVALGKLKGGLDSVGSASEKNALLMKIFGTENASAAGILMDNLDQYGSFLEGIQAGEGGIGAAFEQAAIRMDTADGTISRLKATMNDVFISIGQTMGSGATAMLGFANSVAPTVTAMAGLGQILPTAKIKELAFSMLSKLVPSLFVSDVATKSLVLNKAALSSASIKEIATEALASAGKYAHAAATWALTAAQNALTVAMNLNPLGLIVIGLAAAAAAVYLLYQNFESVRDIIDSVFGAIGDAADYVANIFSGVAGAVGAIFGDSGQSAGEAFTQGFEKGQIEDSIEKTSDKIKAKLADGIKVKLTVDAAESLPGVIESYEKIQAKLDALKSKKADGSMTEADKAEFKALELAAEQASAKIQKIAPETKGTMKTVVDEMGNVKLVYDLNIQKAKEFANSGSAQKNLKVAAKEYSDELVKQAGNIDKQIYLNKENLKAIDAAHGEAAKQKLIDKYQAELKSIEENRTALVASFNEGAKAGLVTSDAIDRIAKTMGVSSEEARKMLVAKALEDAAKAGKLTDEQIAKIAKQFGYSKEKAIELVAAQKKNTAEAQATADAAKSIGDAYDENKKKLQDNHALNKKDLDAFDLRISKGGVLTADEQKRYSQLKQWLEYDAKALVEIDRIEKQSAETYKTTYEEKKKEKQASEDAYQIAKKKFEEDKNIAATARANAKIAEEEAIIASGRLESDLEKRERELKTMTAEGVELGRQKQAVIDLTNAAAKISNKSKTASYAAEIAKMQADLELAISKNTVAKKEFLFKAGLDDEKLKEEISKIESDAKKSQLEFDIKLGKANDSDMIKFQLEELQKKINSSNKKLTAELTLGKYADDGVIAGLNAEISKSANESYQLNLKLAEQLETERIALIADADEKAMALKIANAKKIYEAEKQAAAGNGQAELDALVKFQGEKLAAEQAYLNKRSNVYAVLGDVTSSFKTLNLAKTKKDLSSEISSIESNRKALEDSLSKREISTQEYLEKDAELNEKSRQLKKAQDAQAGLDWKAAASALGDAMQKQADAQIALIDVHFAKRQALEARNLELAQQIEDAKTAMIKAALDERADLYAEAEAKKALATEEQGKNDKELAKNSGAVWTDTMNLMGTQFAAFAAQSGNIGQALAKSLFATAKAMVPTFVTMFFGQSISQLGPILGPITSGVLTASLYGLLAVAESAAGFKRGGFTGEGSPDDTAGIVHKGEYVFTARETSRNRKAFEQISRSNSTVSDWYETTHSDKIKAMVDSQAESIAMQAIIAMQASDRTASVGDYSRLENEMKNVNLKLDALTTETKKGNYNRKTDVNYKMKLELDKDKMIKEVELESFKNLRRM